MATIHNNERQKRALSSQSGVWWVRPLCLGIIGLVFLLLLVPRAKVRSPADESGDAVARHAPGGAPPSVAPRRTPSPGSADPHFALGRPLPGLVPKDGRMAGRHTDAPVQPGKPTQQTRKLDELVAKVKNAPALTPEEANDINQMLPALQAQGTAAVPAIRDLLNQVDDRPLRLALFDLLQQIGGSEALDVSLEQLRRTTDPVEIAKLGWALEQAAPGAYREEVLKAARETLQWAMQIPGKTPDDMSPLFALFQAYGGPDVVADLDRFKPKWWDYALIALAALPAGEGIPKLADLASVPNVPPEYKPRLPFRMLAQASVEHPEAGVVLYDLARAGQVPEGAWSLVGAALEGEHLQFSQPFAAAQESAEQLTQQLALIDALLHVTNTPAAVQALRQARETLLHGRH